MGEGKKTLDKGIAYLKKNGPAAALKRAARKAALLKEPDYQKWYAKQKRAMEKEAARANVQTAAVRRIAPDGEIRETDEYLLFLDADTSADAWAEQIYAQAACSHPRTELFYCDSDSAQTPFCKPDFDRWFLYSANYIGSGYLASAALARRAGEPAGLYKADGAGKYWIQDKGYPRQPFSGRAVLYDYLLRCMENTRDVFHVPWILCHRKAADGQAYREEEQVLAAHFQRTGRQVRICPGAQPWTRRIWRTDGKRPLVSVIIPNKDQVQMLAACLKSIEEKAGYDNCEIIIAENNSEQPETFSFYRRLEKENDRIRILRWQGEFHYSKINNYAASQARGDYLLFLNNDTVMIREGSLAQMVNDMSDGVGAVGARLYYEDGTIQHAGVVIGYGGVAGHAFEGMARQKAEMFPQVVCQRAVSAVTAACMLTAAALFRQLGGFDENLRIAYNDIDLCLRIWENKKAVLYEPYAELIHYESRTRGLELTARQAERVRKEAQAFKERWKDYLEAGDPYYNRNLTLEKADFSLKR